MKYLYILILLCISISCNSKKGKEASADKVIDINEGKEVPLSQIVDSVIYIPLNGKELIGNLFNVKIANDAFFIHDNLSKAILKYDADGNFQYKIHRVGKGPGEYVMITDFLVNNDKVEIINIGNKKMILFDSKGNFIKENRIDTYSWMHMALNDSTVLGYNTPGGIQGEKYYLYLWDKSLNKIKDKKLPFLPYKDKYLGANLYPFSTFKNTIDFCGDFSNIVYSIDKDGSLRPKYKLNFVGYQWPDEEVYKKYHNKTIFDWSKGMKMYVQFVEFMESDNYCYIRFTVNNHLYNVFYNKKKNSSLCAKGFIDDIGLGTKNFKIVGFNQGYWYAIATMGDFQNVEIVKQKGGALTKKMDYIILKLKFI